MSLFRRQTRTEPSVTPSIMEPKEETSTIETIAKRFTTSLLQMGRGGLVSFERSLLIRDYLVQRMLGLERETKDYNQLWNNVLASFEKQHGAGGFIDDEPRDGHQIRTALISALVGDRERILKIANSYVTHYYVHIDHFETAIKLYGLGIASRERWQALAKECVSYDRSDLAITVEALRDQAPSEESLQALRPGMVREKFLEKGVYTKGLAEILSEKHTNVGWGDILYLI